MEAPNRPPPPMTLNTVERAALDALPADARWKFEALATRGEFVEGKSLAQAEGDALAAVVAEFGMSRGASANG